MVKAVTRVKVSVTPDKRGGGLFRSLGGTAAGR